MEMKNSESEGEEFVLSENATVAAIIGTGLLLGIVHVLSGPDHMAAIATLSAGNSWKAFRLGAQWGIGHSIGLVLTAILFLSDVVKLEDFGRVGEPLVGVFMILLACYAFWDVKYNSKTDTKVETEAETVDNLESNQHIKEHLEFDQQLNFTAELLSPPVSSTKNVNSENENIEKEPLLVTEKPVVFPLYKRIISLLIGIIHGVAGPGGVLGVIPAIILDDRLKSSVYLGSFCFASIFIMGLVAAIFGQLTVKLGDLSNTNKSVKKMITKEKVIKGFKILSGVFSLVIGILWISLSATGKLDDIFE